MVQKTGKVVYVRPLSSRALTLAHLARCSAAILRRAEADIVRFLGASAMPFAFAPKVRSEQAFSSRK
jgi:hypothetical protein